MSPLGEQTLGPLDAVTAANAALDEPPPGTTCHLPLPAAPHPTCGAPDTSHPRT